MKCEACFAVTKESEYVEISNAYIIIQQHEQSTELETRQEIKMFHLQIHRCQRVALSLEMKASMFHFFYKTGKKSFHLLFIYITTNGRCCF